MNRYICIGLLSVVLLFASESAAATLYGAAHTGGASAPSTFYTIDPATGGATVVGAIGFNAVGGMAFQPATGVLFAVGKRASDDTDVLLTIDPVTGAGTEVGPLIDIASMGWGGLFDLSFRGYDGRLYLSAARGTGFDLFTVDTATGLATNLGDTTATGGGNGLAFSPDFTLYMGSGPTLFRLDQVAGTGTVQASFSYIGFPALGNPRATAMDFEPDGGVAYVAVNDGMGGAGPNYLGTLDETTGDVTQVGLSVNGLEALAWQPDPAPVPRGLLFGSAHPGGAQSLSTLYRLDPTDGGAAPIGPIGFNAVGGIAFHPVTRVLFGVGKRTTDGVEVLIRIDPATGAGSEIGPLVNVDPMGFGGLFDLSFHGAGGELLLSAIDGEAVFLYSVDPTTGLATQIGDTTAAGAGNGLGSSDSGELWLASDTTLYTLDPATGAGTGGPSFLYLGFPTLNNPRLTAIDFEPLTDVPFAAVNAGMGGAGPNYLAFFDRTNGNTILLGRSPNGLEALAWLPMRDECDVALFGAAHVGGISGASTFYAVDPASGLAGPIGPIGFNAVGGMDFHPSSGVLYAIAKRPSERVDVLITIDPETGTGTEIGPLLNTLDIGGGHYDISFENRTGTLYLIANNPGFTTSLWILDTTSGEATEVGDTTTLDAGNALAFSLTDTLYHVDNLNDGTLHTVDTASGVSSTLLPLTFVGFPTLETPRSNALDFDPGSGTSYLVVNEGSGGSGPNYLTILDPTSGIVTNVGLSVNGLDALAVRGGCDDSEPCTFDSCDICQPLLLGATHQGGVSAPSTLYLIDPAGGAASPIGRVGFDAVGGIDTHPVTGLVYGVGKRPADGIDVAIVIEPLSGRGTEIGPLVNTDPGNGGGHFDVSFRNSDGVLFLTAFDAGGNVSLFTVDLTTGIATEIGDTTTVDAGQALGFTGIDGLFLADDDAGGSLYRVNQATGVATPEEFLTYVGFPTLTLPRSNALDFNPCEPGAIVSINDGTAGSGPNYIGALDVQTGVLTQLGQTVPGLDAVTWQPIDRGSCRHAEVPDIDLDGFCDTIDNCPQVPNPTQGAAPFAQTMLAPGKASFDWTDPLDVLIVDGELAALDTYTFQNASSAALATGFASGPAPGTGVGRYYLVRPNCPAGSWVSGGGGECAAPGVCPPGGRDGNLP